jgi:hypothetical protein
LPDQLLQNHDESQFAKWRRYLQLKSQCYLAYSFAFQGESLLAEDKCGDAVRACKEGIACYQLAVDFAGKYAKVRERGGGVVLGPGREIAPNRRE